METRVYEFENPMVLPVLRFPGFSNFEVDIDRCGCGRVARFAVYEDRQPHCLSCKNDATDCKVKILVEVL